MKTAEELLRILEVKNYTARHIKIINDFIKSEEKNVKKLLDQLGGWDNDDFRRAEIWMKSDQSRPTSLPSDEEIEESLKYNSALQYDNERECALIGAKWMRSIAAARIAELEMEMTSFRDLARLISALNEEHEYFKSIEGDIKLARKLLTNTTP